MAKVCLLRLDYVGQLLLFCIMNIIFWLFLLFIGYEDPILKAVAGLLKIFRVKIPIALPLDGNFGFFYQVCCKMFCVGSASPNDWIRAGYLLFLPPINISFDRTLHSGWTHHIYCSCRLTYYCILPPPYIFRLTFFSKYVIASFDCGICISQSMAYLHLDFTS